VVIVPSTYVDRGIIKWAAFDALVGYQTMLEEMKYKRGKKAAPSLTDDSYERLNRIIILAYQNKQEIGFRYYLDGYVKTTYGVIVKLDFTYHTIKLSTQELFKAEDIVDIIACDIDE